MLIVLSKSVHPYLSHALWRRYFSLNGVRIIFLLLQNKKVQKTKNQIITLLFITATLPFSFDWYQGAREINKYIFARSIGYNAK